MKHRFSNCRAGIAGCAALFLLALVAVSRSAMAEAPPSAIPAFNSYVGVVEARLAEQHRTPGGFLASLTAVQQSDARLKSGALIVERLTPEEDLPGAMLHDWRGTLFVPRGKAQDLERLLIDFNSYPEKFSPQIVRAQELSHVDAGGLHRVQASMRIRQKHLITVVMDTTYDVTFGQSDPQHGYSLSRSTQVSEIDAPGTREEHALNAKEEHGFLWRLNTYWSWEERDGGLYIQIESVSLTRSIPRGFAWLIGPFVESVPRESLEFTLRSASAALRN
jgi:hypothetical protein